MKFYCFRYVSLVHYAFPSYYLNIDAFYILDSLLIRIVICLTAETSCFNQTCPDNSHCEQIRHSNNSIETSCVCDQGLQWDAAAGYCKAIDACERRETCSQICVNVDGGYRCECYPGYTIENNTYCRASGKPVMLYYANRYDIRRLTTDTLTMSIMVGETQSSVALDFDYEDGLIFWTDVSLEKIMR